MAKAQLYEYAIIRHPKPANKNEHSPPSELIAGIEQVLAASEEEAAMKAARAIPDEHAEHLDEIEVQIRPFG